MVLVNREEIQQVVLNLILNAEQAIRSARREGVIAVRTEITDAGAIVEVRDDGPGIPAESRERIVDALFTTKARGTGLGLALCRRVIDAHRGEIGLLPTERGAAFRLWLPDPADARADEPA